MKLTVKRLDERGKYETLIARDDGVTFSMRGVGHNFAIPHDIAHFVVERALRLDCGFWGSVAVGAVFPTMTYVSGRRKPKAAERSKALLKANARKLVEAEVLVRIFNETMERGYRENSTWLHKSLQEHSSPPIERSRSISQAQISTVFADYGRIVSSWNDTPVGGTLQLVWESPRNR